MELRKIIHVDMDAFFASVEQRDNPSLLGLPVIVGGKPDSRGVVAACSYEARKFGVHSAMPSSTAYRLCPKAIFVAPRFDAYREASLQINEIFKQFTKLVEPLSLDEAYLDVTDIAGRSHSATAVAAEIKSEIKSNVNLTASAGVSYNKFLAKIASDMDKPDGLFVIKPDKAEAFVEQLEIRKFFGVGKVTEKKMHSLGIFIGADLKKLDLVQLQTQFGRSGSYFYNIVRGIDDRPVRARRQRKSIGKETTFADNVVDKREIWDTLQNIAEKLEIIMREKQIIARTVTLKAKYANFQLITRSQTTTDRVLTSANILSILPKLLKKTEVGKRPIRLIGVTLSNLQAQSDAEDKRDKINVYENQLGLFY